MANRIQVSDVRAGALTLYVTDCANCGVVFAISTDYEKRRRSDHQGFYCPNGHDQYFNDKTDMEKRADAARAEADRLRAKLVAEQDQARAARDEAAAAKASEVRLRWRVGNGVCPCCQRSFPALAAHVATKHPDYTSGDLAALSTRMRELLASIRSVTESEDSAVVDISDVPGFTHTTVSALERRGLVERISYDRVALTEAGWPLAELAATD